MSVNRPQEPAGREICAECGGIGDHDIECSTLYIPLEAQGTLTMGVTDSRHEQDPTSAQLCRTVARNIGDLRCPATLVAPWADTAVKLIKLSDALMALDTAANGCGLRWDDGGSFDRVCSDNGLCMGCEERRDAAILTLLGQEFKDHV